MTESRVLEQLIDDFRHAYSGESDQAVVTKERIMLSLSRRPPRSRRRGWVLGGLLVSAGAAAMVGQRYGDASEDVAPAVNSDPQLVQDQEPAVEPWAPAVTSTDGRETPPSPKRNSVAALPPRKLRPHEEPLPGPHPLYLQAHRAHFGGVRPEEVLEKWDLYLQTQIGGSLQVEARYNRAITLLRLRRWEDAAVALRDFAHGKYGDYRRADAQRMLDDLNRGLLQKPTTR